MEQYSSTLLQEYKRLQAELAQAKADLKNAEEEALADRESNIAVYKALQDIEYTGTYADGINKLSEQNAALAMRVKELEDALSLAVRQNEHDMLITGDELRAAEKALAISTQSAEEILAAHDARIRVKAIERVLQGLRSEADSQQLRAIIASVEDMITAPKENSHGN